MTTCSPSIVQLHSSGSTRAKSFSKLSTFFPSTATVSDAPEPKPTFTRLAAPLPSSPHRTRTSTSSSVCVQLYGPASSPPPGKCSVSPRL
eukprot:CAMPEP_0205893814 /NCGR_PEP_ID=MMETSP1083-20121108/23477_1 /ASSEMBLY_ACC=CAM_ASM_000430 /TAXON_ID=97485 /ORGANISM="Prymnesium parvum, Strain Texoma1" /LENGTH=89 /DNA_ID=CAMNT_0053258557 /DNA_START=346 /DNA_END=612 /DNA_ORIENTATION=+